MTKKCMGHKLVSFTWLLFFCCCWHDEELNNSRDPWSTGNFTSMPPGRLPNMAVLGFGGRPKDRPTSCYRDYILQLTWKNLRIPKGQAIPTIINWFDFRQVTWSISGYHCTSRFPSLNLSNLRVTVTHLFTLSMWILSKHLFSVHLPISTHPWSG